MKDERGIASNNNRKDTEQNNNIHQPHDKNVQPSKNNIIGLSKAKNSVERDSVTKLTM